MYFIIDTRFKKFNFNFSHIEVSHIFWWYFIPNITNRVNHLMSSFNHYYDRKQLFRISDKRDQISRKHNIETQILLWFIDKPINYDIQSFRSCSNMIWFPACNELRKSYLSHIFGDTVVLIMHHFKDSSNLHYFGQP